MATILESYDFVVVGGGTAGLVVATRLSEDPSQSVLVLEAGSDLSDDPRVKTPGLCFSLFGTEADWGFQTPNQLNLDGRKIILPQGKALGGSSAINAHVFVPPARGLIDAWQSLGNDSWGWDSLQKYFARVYTPPSVSHDSEKYLGLEGCKIVNDSATGPIQTSFPGDVYHPGRLAWAEAFKNKGLYMENDPFVNPAIGAFSCLASIDPVRKERSYATSAYYSPNKGRENLTILTSSLVEKVLFDTRSGLTRATAVQYKHNNEVRTAVATKEVIVAAGVLNSPKILELSGIGSADLLKRHGIAVVIDLPEVGENLQDHLTCGIGYEAVEGVETLDALMRQEPEAIEKALNEYATSQSGLFATVGFGSYAFLPVTQAVSTEDYGTLEGLLQRQRPQSTQARAYHDIAEKTLLSPSESSAVYFSFNAQSPLPMQPDFKYPSDPMPGKFFTIGTILAQPLSRGSVHISSSDASAIPIVDPGYLSNPIDTEVFAHQMLYIDTIAATSPIKDLLKQPLRRRDPDSHLVDLDAARKYVRGSSISNWHLAGTCAMLPRDKGGVVDAELRLYGVENLRIVDSSAIPLVSTANLQSTVYAFAERAADLIKGSYGI
ncbi:GMC oxidoreductase [Hypomontagnella submonticulosa]|nr:GMC oxidoreductase [Hypomontagnella submonticulosa]